MKNKTELPKFNNENEERNFWATHELTDVFNPKTSKRFRPIFTNLKPSTQSITVRLSKSMVDSLKMLANEQDVPYQSLMKVYLNEKIQNAFQKKIFNVKDDLMMKDRSKKRYSTKKMGTVHKVTVVNSKLYCNDSIK